MRAAWLALAALALAACATVPQEPPPQPPPVLPEPAAEPEPPTEPAEPMPPVPAAAEPAAALRALHYYSQLKQRPAPEQRLEQERLRKALAASRSDHDRIRLALALSLPGSTPRDEAQALELLEPILRDSRSDYQELAVLLASLLGEQRRRGDQAAALHLKLERIKALEKEMLERSTSREPRPR